MAKKLAQSKKLKQRKFSLNDDDWHKVKLEAQSMKISVSDLVRKKLNVGQNIQAKSFDRRPTKKADPQLLKLIKNFTTNLNQIAKHCNTNKELDNIALELLSEMSTDIKNLVDLKSNKTLVIDSVTSKISEPETLDEYQILNYQDNIKDDIQEEIKDNTIVQDEINSSENDVSEELDFLDDIVEDIENDTSTIINNVVNRVENESKVVYDDSFVDELIHEIDVDGFNEDNINSLELLLKDEFANINKDTIRQLLEVGKEKLSKVN